ncbi:MAG: DUF167 domain-containing protein [Candidatus Peregrinibacteria bacterium]|nr:DUF167 domain-containing protein [Candidatus Peregrinibacteria bacterium]MDZ4245399.1 DUF167 domain-containing protein [Candidatus Gracilibacteria bacterium]
MQRVIQLIKANDGYLRIKVLPKSAKNEIVDIMDDETIKIRIKAIPEKGKANQALIKFLSQELDIQKDSIKIISGKTDQVKLIKITT